LDTDSFLDWGFNPLREYSPHDDELYALIRDELIDAIQVVLRADKMAARKAHRITPHLRLKDLNNIKNDDVADYSVRRLANIAGGLGIRVAAFHVQLPDTHVG
jgi:hypothetical protein